MTFSASINNIELRTQICAYCFETFVAGSDYQTYQHLIDMSEITILLRGNALKYLSYKEGDNKNYKIIKTARELITECNTKYLSTYFIPDIMKIVLEYCAFARYISFDKN
jgi:hypothetical protein